MTKNTVNELLSLEREAQEKLKQATSQKEIEDLRIAYLGKKGKVAAISHTLPTLSSEEKAEIGRNLNAIKTNLELLFSQSLQSFRQVSPTKTFFDPTMPGTTYPLGAMHPISKVIYEVTDIFRYLGFSVASGPEIELDEINFQKLRLYPTHPSRDTQETYYLSEEILLRVHTSSVQIRYMQEHEPPIRIISPGRVYRRDRIDATHLPSFFQIEGLLVDDCSKLTDLLGTLSFFVKRLFGESRKVRFYGHNFPYTEPSLEVEVLSEEGKWLEILGSGMVHPEVLENCGIDSKKYRGWAFGMGADRLAMLKYGIHDIRNLYSGDIRFLSPK